MYIRTVYKDLIAPSLLDRCLKGKTQNPNESLHSKLWAKCPKAKFAGRFRVAFVCRVTVLEHNFGRKANLMTHMFGTNEAITTSLEIQEAETERVTTRKPNKKRKLTYSAEYQPGAF